MGISAVILVVKVKPPTITFTLGKNGISKGWELFLTRTMVKIKPPSPTIPSPVANLSQRVGTWMGLSSPKNLSLFSQTFSYVEGM